MSPSGGASGATDLNRPRHGRACCSVRGHGRHPFGDMTDTFAARQVDGGDLMGGEENAVLGTAWRRPDGKTLSAEGLRNLPEPALEADVSLGGRYGPHNLVAVIFGRWQAVGHRSLARSIAACRHLLLKRLVRPFEIVDLAPGIEGLLRLGEIAKTAQCEHFGIEGAMKALVLAAALRMVGTTVNDRDAELEKPHRKPRPTFTRRVSPRGAIIDEERLRQAVTSEG